MAGIQRQRRVKGAELFKAVAQLTEAAARKVGPADGAVEQRIARIHGVIRHVAHAALSMPGRMYDADAAAADGQYIAVVQYTLRGAKSEAFSEKVFIFVFYSNFDIKTLDFY